MKNLQRTKRLKFLKIKSLKWINALFGLWCAIGGALAKHRYLDVQRPPFAPSAALQTPRAFFQQQHIPPTDISVAAPQSLEYGRAHRTARVPQPAAPAACCRCLHTNSVTAFIDRINTIFSFLKEPETNDRQGEQTSAFLELCGVTVASRGSSCVMIVCSLDRAEGGGRALLAGSFSPLTESLFPGHWPGAMRP